MQVADVDLITSSIVQTLLEDEIEVLYGADWKSSGEPGCLSPSIQQRGLDAIRQLLVKARAVSQDGEIRGVATEVFRKATNGKNHLENICKCGIPVQLISQDKEAELELKTALSGGRFNSETCIAWDSGGASFQITTPENSYLGEFGSSVITSHLVHNIRRQKLNLDSTSQINPVTLEEAKQLILHVQQNTPEVPLWLAVRINNAAHDDITLTATKRPSSAVDIVGIGGPTSLFSLASQLADLDPTLTLAPSDVWSAILRSVDKDEQFFAGIPQSQMVVPKLCLMYAMMEKLELPGVYYQKALGCCPGLLVHPKFWSS